MLKVSVFVVVVNFVFGHIRQAGLCGHLTGCYLRVCLP